MTQMQMKPFDPDLPIQRQLEEEGGPVVLVNVFTLDPGDEAAFLEAWQSDAVFMKAQPGLISIQMHRAVGRNATFLNHAVWETVQAFRAAFTPPTFRAKLQDYPTSTVASPHLFRRIAVPNVCTA